VYKNCKWDVWGRGKASIWGKLPPLSQCSYVPAESLDLMRPGATVHPMKYLQQAEISSNTKNVWPKSKLIRKV